MSSESLAWIVSIVHFAPNIRIDPLFIQPLDSSEGVEGFSALHSIPMEDELHEAATEVDDAAATLLSNVDGDTNSTPFDELLSHPVGNVGADNGRQSSVEKSLLHAMTNSLDNNVEVNNTTILSAVNPNIGLVDDVAHEEALGAFVATSGNAVSLSSGLPDGRVLNTDGDVGNVDYELSDSDSSSLDSVDELEPSKPHTAAKPDGTALHLDEGAQYDIPIDSKKEEEQEKEMFVSKQPLDENVAYALQNIKVMVGTWNLHAKVSERKFADQAVNLQRLTPT